MLKGAIIGFGRMGLTHFSILNNHPDVKFVAVTDSSSFMLKNIKKYIGLETFTNYKEMFQKMKLDFVIVATPTSSHKDVAKFAIENNVHIFLEKPFALNSSEGKELLTQLENKNLVNQVGYVLRFNKIFMKAKEIIASGLLGDIFNFRVEMYGPTVLKESKSSWRSQRKEGGGCLYDFASHAVDTINYMIGPPNKVRGSVLKHIFSKDVEDAVYSTFIYENNLSGHLLSNWSDPTFRKPSYRIEFSGYNGKIIADLHSYKLYLKKAPKGSEYSDGWNISYISDFGASVRYYVRGNEFSSQLDYFIECIKNNSESRICSFRDGYITDTIIESIVNNAIH